MDTSFVNDRKSERVTVQIGNSFRRVVPTWDAWLLEAELKQRLDLPEPERTEAMEFCELAGLEWAAGEPEPLGFWRGLVPWLAIVAAAYVSAWAFWEWMQ